jgi:hypothetical protein
LNGPTSLFVPISEALLVAHKLHIPFYIPENFQPKVKWIPAAGPGKVVEFPVATPTKRSA